MAVLSTLRDKSTQDQNCFVGHVYRLVPLAPEKGKTQYSPAHQLVNLPVKALALIPSNDSVTNIEASAFRGCASLTTITIPSNAVLDYFAFSGCTSLKGAYFLGDAPVENNSFFSNDDRMTVYYLPGTTGWGQTFGGHPTALWKPEVQASEPSFGVRSNRFGFTISRASDKVVVIEAATDLSNPTWSPLATNTLTGGSSAFRDLQWANYPSRFYRIRTP
jgi:hypothetical protein